MKYLIFLIFIFFSNLAGAQIYKCKFPSGEAIIDTNEDIRTLKSGNPQTGEFERVDKIYAMFGNVAQVTFIPEKPFAPKKQTYEAYVFQDSKPGDQNYFKLTFFESSFLRVNANTIVIKTWEKKLPAYLFLSDNPDVVENGNCK